jgi:hypothetical protein
MDLSAVPLLPFLAIGFLQEITKISHREGLSLNSGGDSVARKASAEMVCNANLFHLPWLVHCYKRTFESRYLRKAHTQAANIGRRAAK